MQNFNQHKKKTQIKQKKKKKLLTFFIEQIQRVNKHLKRVYN